MKCAIFAIDQEFGFGNNNGTLPWGPPIKEDMDVFKSITKETKNVIMGAKTFISLPSKLKGRTNIVLVSPNSNTSDVIAKDGSLPDLLIAKGKTQSFKDVDKKVAGYGVKTYSVIGGKLILESAITSGCLDNVYLTVVSGVYGADIKLNIDQKKLKLITATCEHKTNIKFCKFEVLK